MGVLRQKHPYFERKTPVFFRKSFWEKQEANFVITLLCISKIFPNIANRRESVI